MFLFGNLILKYQKDWVSTENGLGRSLDVFEFGRFAITPLMVGFGTILATSCDQWAGMDARSWTNAVTAARRSDRTDASSTICSVSTSLATSPCQTPPPCQHATLSHVAMSTRHPVTRRRVNTSHAAMSTHHLVTRRRRVNTSPCHMPPPCQHVTLSHAATVSTCHPVTRRRVNTSPCHTPTPCQHVTMAHAAAMSTHHPLTRRHVKTPPCHTPPPCHHITLSHATAVSTHHPVTRRRRVNTSPCQHITLSHAAAVSRRHHGTCRRRRVNASTTRLNNSAQQLGSTLACRVGSVIPIN